jgi:hypothetical protein
MQPPRPQRMRPNPLDVSLAFLALVLFAGACSTPRSGSSAQTSPATADANGPVDWNVTPPPRHVTGKPVRVKYVAYARGQNCEIVNESHTNPHEHYSKKVSLAQAYTKIQSDEVVQALLERLDDQGMKGRLQPGRAPELAVGSKAQALEVETDAGVRSWLVQEKSPQAERVAFLKCVKDFVELYNATNQMQAVDYLPEWTGRSQGRATKDSAPRGGKVQ